MTDVWAFPVERESCPYCGRESACEFCNRCDDDDCNAGCINCVDKEDWDVFSQMIVDHPIPTITALLGIFILAFLHV